MTTALEALYAAYEEARSRLECTAHAIPRLERFRLEARERVLRQQIEAVADAEVLAELDSRQGNGPQSAEPRKDQSQSGFCSASFYGQQNRPSVDPAIHDPFALSHDRARACEQAVYAASEEA